MIGPNSPTIPSGAPRFRVRVRKNFGLDRRGQLAALLGGLVAAGILLAGLTSLHAITVEGFGPNGESGRRHGQRLTIGEGGEVFELDAFLALGAAPALRLSDEPLPPELVFTFESSLSDDASDLSLVYRLRNDGELSAEVRFFSFLDVDIDEEINSFDNEHAEVLGSLGAGPGDEDPDGFEVDERGLVSGDILENLLAGRLDDTNAVPAARPECVAMALAFELGALAPGETARIEILISEAGRRLGSFAIVQSDADPASATRVTYSGQARIESAKDAPLFVRGDANGDGRIELADAVFTLNALFLGGPSAACPDAANANGDSIVDLADAVYTLNFLFLGGFPPPSPYPLCGRPEGGTELGCTPCACPPYPAGHPCAL